MILLSIPFLGWAFRGNRDDIQVMPYRVAPEALADGVQGSNWWMCLFLARLAKKGDTLAVKIPLKRGHCYLLENRQKGEKR